MQKLLAVPNLPPGTQAVSYALAIMEQMKANSWADIEAGKVNVKSSQAVRDIVLDRDQADLILQYSDYIRLVRRGRPKINCAQCDTCGTFAFYTGTAPKKCRHPGGCPGRLIVAIPAKRREIVTH